MEITVVLDPARLAAACGVGLVFGSGYAWLLNHQLRWLARDATELSVVIGVILTLILALALIPWLLVAALALLFVATGLPQVVRSAYNRCHIPAADARKGVVNMAERVREVAS